MPRSIDRVLSVLLPVLGRVGWAIPRVTRLELTCELAASRSGHDAGAGGSGDPDAGQVLRAGPVLARLAGVAGAEEAGEATRHCGDHEDRPCLKGDIHYPAASGQGIRDRR